VTEDLIFRFLGYDLLSGVLHDISGSLEALTGIGRGTATTLSGAFSQVGTAAMGLGAGMVGAGAAIAYGMGDAAMAAAKFQSQLTLLMTHAGASQPVMEQLGGWALKVAGQLGFDPTSLVTATYHVQSVLTSLPQNLRDVAHEEAVVYGASQLAAIGHADLEESINAVAKAYVVYGKDGLSAADITAIFNKTVGEGNMRLTDLNAAFSSGLLPVAEQSGVSLQSLGAALATMTDEGIPAARAAVYLRSALIQMTIPSNAAVGALEAIGVAANDSVSQVGSFNQVLVQAGINQTDVAKELQATGNLGDTLVWLKNKMTDAGVSGQDAAALLAKAFGGIRSGTGIVTLYNNIDGLIQKEKDARQATQDWSATWDNFTQSDPTFQIHQLEASWQTLVIILGDAFLPVMLKVIATATPFVIMVGQWIAKNSDLVASMAQGAVVFLIVGGAIVFFAGIIGRIIGFLIPIITFFWEFGSAIAASVASVAAAGDEFASVGAIIGTAFGGPVTIAIAVILALVAVGVLLVTHWQQIRALAVTIWGMISSYVMKAVADIRAIIQTELTWIMNTWKQHHTQIMAVAQAAWTAIKVLFLGALVALGAVIVIVAAIIIGIVIVILAVAAAVMWLVGKFMDLVQFLAGQVPKAIAAVGAFFSWLGTKANELGQTILAFANRAWQTISSFFGNIIGAAERAWSQFSSHPAYWLGYLLGVIIIFNDKVAKAIGDFLVWLVKTAIEKWNAFVNAALTFLDNLIKGIIKFNEDSSKKISDFFVWVVQTASQKWNQFVNAAITELTHLPGQVWNILQQLPGVFNNVLDFLANIIATGVPKIITTFTNLLNGLITDVWNIGQSIVQGLWNGIQSLVGWLGGQISSWLSGLVAGMKSSISSGSPSLLVAQEIGVPMAQGIVMGMQMEMPNTQSLLNTSLIGLVNNAGNTVRNQPSPVNINQNQNQNILLKIDNQVLARTTINNINQWREIMEIP
jgi:TP901 family phage tail tape measure protein